MGPYKRYLARIVSSCLDPDIVMACCRKLLASSINDRMRQL